VFKKFGADNALRLDGGTAAAMVVGGQVVNPLKGAYELLIGPLRDIAYAVTLR
jgi:exopolysaccharide biosynthesis protein